MRIAINGFGRIGRNFFRVLLSDAQALKKITIVAINVGPDNPEHTAYLAKYDSVMGTFKNDIEYEDGYLIVENQKIKVFASTDVGKIDWGALKVDWVVDASGKYTTREKAAEHITSGALNVLISAPAQGEDVTIIPGVNDDAFDGSRDHIVSLGSCSTNALAPMLKVMDVAFGIKQACMTSIHSYTNSQVLLDSDMKDLRRARAAAINIIPTTTGATKTVTKVMPELVGKISGGSIRVPVAKVSLIDLTVVTEKEISIEKINQAFGTASKHEPFRNIIGVTYEPLVSCDFSGISESVVIDTLLTNVNNSCAKIYGWYDNEWGYSMRLKDFLFSVA